MTDWHPYAHGGQRSATVWIAVLGVVAAWAWGAGTRAANWSPPWWLDTPAVFGFYGILYALYDRVLWRVAPLRKLHGVPNLNGKYQVTIHSSHDGHATAHQGTASIAQSWSRIVVRIETGSSTSYSRTAWMTDAPGVGVTVTYVFENRPKSAAAPALTPHEGTAVLTFDSTRRGTGTYYTGRGRTNHGDMTLEPN